jgi:hypothetical protein
MLQNPVTRWHEFVEFPVEENKHVAPRDMHISPQALVNTGNPKSMHSNMTGRGKTNLNLSVHGSL